MSTTLYGTIPASTSPDPATNLEYVSRAKRRFMAGLGTRRPWRLMFSFNSFTVPANFREALTSRATANINYFRVNYAILAHLIVFFTLLWHPFSMIVLIIMMALWLFMYFLRDEPLLIFGRLVDDRLVLIVLAVLTLVFLFLTDAPLNILVGLLIAAAAVVAHAAFRKLDDLFLDEESVTAAGFMAAVPEHHHHHQDVHHDDHHHHQAASNNNSC